MSLKLIFLIFSSLIGVSLCGIAHYLKPAGKPGDCWTEYTGPMETNEKKTIIIDNDCIGISCYGSDAEILSCPYIVRGDKRTTPVDPSKPYPGCCKKPLGKVISMVG